MAVPVMVAGNVLARVAVAHAPRFAAMLAAAHKNGKPVMVDQNYSDASPAAKSTVSGMGTVAKWALGATGVGAGVIMALEMTGTMKPVEEAFEKKMSDLYTRLLGQKGGQSKLRTADQQIEDLKPAEAGKTADNVETTKLNTPEQRDADAMTLSASIIGTSFPGLDRTKSGGAFDASVLAKVKEAANVIAPKKPMSSWTDLEKRAVATAAIFGSNGEFLKTMKSQDPKSFDLGGPAAGKKLLEFAQKAPSSGDVAKDFMKDGVFSADLFKDKTNMLAGAAGAGGGVGQIASASPAGLKVMLLAAAAEKAGAAVAAITDKGGEKGAIGQWAAQNLKGFKLSLASRQHKMQMSHQPQDQESVPSN